MFSNAVMMLVYMLAGIFICKIKKATPDHAKSMSGLLIYILGPMMIINSFLRLECTTEIITKIFGFFVTTFILQVLFIGMLCIIFHKKFHDAKYRIFTCASVLGNVGFLGIPVVTGMYPTEPIAACYSSIFVMSMNIIVFTLGSFLITNDKKYISIKSIIFNPTTIALMIALPIFLLKIKLPGPLDSAVELLGKMATPVCLIILGMRLSVVSPKALFTRPFIYAACFCKLLIFPLFALICVIKIPFFDTVFKGCVIVLASAPAGAIIESLAELYECEQELSANAVLLTTIFSMLTMPIIISLVTALTAAGLC